MDIWPRTQADYDWLDRRIDVAIYDTNREMYLMSAYELKEALKGVPGAERLTVNYAANGNQLITIRDKTVEVSPMASNDEIRSAFQHPTIPTKNTRVTMTPIDRLKGKFLQARGVAQRVASNMEAEADSLIAQEDAFKSKTEQAFAPHKAILAEAGTELKAIEEALNLMSNGGPALDPLKDAGATGAGLKNG